MSVYAERRSADEEGIQDADEDALDDGVDPVHVGYVRPCFALADEAEVRLGHRLQPCPWPGAG
jgi:hypothetical protein